MQGAASRIGARWCLSGLHRGNMRRRGETRPRQDLVLCGGAHVHLTFFFFSFLCQSRFVFATVSILYPGVMCL